jgi:hypothetical protein
MSTTSHGWGKLFPAILIPRLLRTPLRPPSQATSHCARARTLSDSFGEAAGAWPYCEPALAA